jgi:hypothetical protein
MVMVITKPNQTKTKLVLVTNFTRGLVLVLILDNKNQPDDRLSDESTL